MSTISTDGRYVQLWDLLTDVPVGETLLPERCEMRREMGQKVKDNLNMAARVMGQEYEMQVDEAGVTLNVFSCEGGSFVVRVCIPKDRKMPIQVDVGQGHKAAMWRHFRKPGKAGKMATKCAGRIR